MQQPDDLQELRNKMLAALQAHWKPLLWQGILLMLLGVAAVLAPGYSTLAAEILFGWLMLLAGTLRLPGAIRSRQTPGAGWHIFSAVLLLLLGLLLIFQPLTGVVTLTQVVIFYLVWHAIASVMFSFRLKPLTRGWLAMAVSAVIDVVLVGIIVAGWPETAHWVLGVMLGCNLFFFGMALTFIALNNRSAK